MGKMGTYLKNKILDYVYSKAEFTPATTLYMGLSTTTISADGGNITEPTGNGYARVAVTNNATNFPAASSGAKSNGVDISFITPTGDWGEVTDFFLTDAETGDGNFYGGGALASPQTINSGNIVTFKAGDLDISLT